MASCRNCLHNDLLARSAASTLYMITVINRSDRSPARRSQVTLMRPNDHGIVRTTPAPAMNLPLVSFVFISAISRENGRKTLANLSSHIERNTSVGRFEFLLKRLTVHRP